MILNVWLEIIDRSESDSEDVQLILEDLLTEYLPSDLTARVIDVEVVDNES